MEFKIVGRQLADPHQPKEFTVLYQLRRKIFGNEDVVVVARRIPVPYQHLDLVGRELPITDAAPVLNIAEIIFVFSLGQIPVIDKGVAQGIYRTFFDFVHSYSTVTLLARFLGLSTSYPFATPL